MAKKRLGDLLLDFKAKTPGSMPTLSPGSIEQAVATQKLEGGRLGEILLKMRVITEEDLLRRGLLRLPGRGCSPARAECAQAREPDYAWPSSRR